jgi:D-serine deaminase-like pyridoxal phosphate-dependent protein
VSELVLETPYASVDLDVVERNIARLQAYCDEHGLACRPHIKTHKLPAVAHLQIRAGAVGITCQKLGEAEVMAAAGIDDILITYPLLGRPRLDRLRALAREARIAIAADSAVVAQGLSDALAATDAELDFLVECDTGLGRTGVQTPREARELAERVSGLPGLRFAGLMTYPTGPRSGAFLSEARAAIEAAGMTVERVSGGGTQGMFETHESPVITELRAGTYVYGDRACIAHGTARVEDVALRVRATVVSRPTERRAILDAGSKALTTDPVEAEGEDGYGMIVERPGARIVELFEEHALVELSPAEPDLAIGDEVTILPNHACGTTNMHDELLAHRSGRPVGIWRVQARGALR